MFFWGTRYELPKQQWRTLWFEVRQGWLAAYNTPGSRRLALNQQAEAVFALELCHTAVRPVRRTSLPEAGAAI